ncbi:IS110 family transposase [Serinicoccus sp. CUA-874]|uniref:IS110 family transposase n=1 Tax=Serinicoccus sp. CUA-874 TaxID=1517939 RepID=UPI000962516B|nr:IS110 family transposase [Serinicoccus sp. CUA-874]OLT16016.1 IS110 family transposase [Serinicoccus sp. CUA-874]
MVMIGTDSHKRTHTFVAVDDVGRRLGGCTLRANTDGHLQLLTWAAQFQEVTFALEDCRHLTRRLEGDLLRAGQRVVRVPTRLMAGARRGARTPGKSDPIDAEAVAVAALRHPGLPVAELDGPARQVKLLSDYRRDLVMQRTRACCQLRWHLHELDPDLALPSRSLRQANTRARVEAFLDTQDGIVVRLARKLLVRIADLSEEIKDIEKELKTLVADQAPTLLSLPGCGVFSAAVIIGETAGVHRFRDKDAFARFTGTAPVPVWSGASAGKVRLNRGGNRQMNYALHMIALTQARGVGPGQAYLAKAGARGKDRVAAMRLLRRRLSDAIYSALRADQIPASTHIQQAA